MDEHADAPRGIPPAPTSAELDLAVRLALARFLISGRPGPAATVAPDPRAPVAEGDGQTAAGDGPSV